MKLIERAQEKRKLYQRWTDEAQAMLDEISRWPRELLEIEGARGDLTNGKLTLDIYTDEHSSVIDTIQKYGWSQIEEGLLSDGRYRGAGEMVVNGRPVTANVYGLPLPEGLVIEECKLPPCQQQRAFRLVKIAEIMEGDNDGQQVQTDHQVQTDGG